GYRPLTEVAALKAIAEVRSQGHAAAAQADRLRTACRVVGDAHAGAACTAGRGSESHADGAGGAGCQRAWAIVGLGEVTGIGARHSYAADGQRPAAAVGQGHRLRRARRVDILIAKAQARRTQAHRWGGVERTVVGASNRDIVVV